MRPLPFSFRARRSFTPSPAGIDAPEFVRILSDAIRGAFPRFLAAASDYGLRNASPPARDAASIAARIAAYLSPLADEGGRPMRAVDADFAVRIRDLSRASSAL